MVLDRSSLLRDRSLEDDRETCVDAAIACAMNVPLEVGVPGVPTLVSSELVLLLGLVAPVGAVECSFILERELLASDTDPCV
jgi:hypothetical protein